ncbi:MAG: DUF4238 domain-containing protein [Acidobacteria bacterium]|nr:DUF4238 domain-containing protein [Acidobacteriota bacterium]
MPARKHHYVPQWYIRKWGDEKGQVAFSRNGTIFSPTNPANILAKRDFYAAPTLTVEDIASLSLFVATKSSPAVRPVAEALLQEALLHSTMKTVLLQSPDLANEDKAEIASFLKEAEERRFAVFESRAKRVVDRLLETGVDILEDPESAAQLLEFVTGMYFRTLRAREVGRQLRPSTDEGIAVLTRLLAAMMAHSLFFDRLAMPTTLLTNDTGRRFITSDNPAVNILRPDEDRVPTDDEWAVYMPLSPRHALIIPPLDHAFTLEASTEELVAALNASLASFARETLVASSKCDLIDALGGPPRDLASMRRWFKPGASQ